MGQGGSGGAESGGGMVAVLASGTEIPVGRTFQDALRARLRA